MMSFRTVRFARSGTVGVAFAAIVLGAAAAQAGSCRSSAGDRQAARLVERCIAVSPATHPPCNAANDCALIESEITRGCRMIGNGSAPAFCRHY